MRALNQLSITLTALLFLIAPQTSPAEDVCVMSFNIRYGTARDGENHWDNRKEFVAETIAAFNPDLLGTQETLGFQKRFLESKLPAYTSLGIGRDDGGQNGEMTAIYYRTKRFERLAEGHFWLSETPNVPGSKSWDSSLPRICSWVKLRDLKQTTPPILFMNTHFDHRGAQARLESARLLRQKMTELGKGCRIVLTGDFNTPVDSTPYLTLFSSDVASSENTLLDTYRIAKPADEAGEGTFSGFKGGKTDGNRIDWIAVSHHWKVHSAHIDRTQRDHRTPSDHYPVTAIIGKKSN